MRLACAGISSWFERGAQIIVPSRLLASVTAHQFSTYQLERGLDSWQVPSIHGVDAWLASRWQEARYAGAAVPTLLSPLQERFVWQQLIEREHPQLFDITATAGLAQRAAKILCEWRIPLESDTWNEYVDAQQFQRWYKQFRRRCQDEWWIARSDIWNLLPGWFDSGACSRKRTVFAGFETFSPALEQVRAALADFAISENTSPFTGKEKTPARELSSFEQEVEAAARGARARFEHQPGSSIAVFVTDLRSRRAFVERMFQRVFYPSNSASLPFRNSLGDAAEPEDSVFHIEAAPLRGHPLIASALLLQELARPRISVADAGAILRCPFIAGAAAERSVRAVAELELRRKRELDVTVRDLEQASRNAPALQKMWIAVRRVLGTAKGEKEFPAWSKCVGDLLEAIGWPGELQLNAWEQNEVDGWNNALSSLATLGLVSGRVSFDTAISKLRHILSNAAAERGDWSSPVHILDASDASGLRCDYAILTGLSEESWPPPVSASALIPLKLQRLHNVPGASPKSFQREQEIRARQLFGAAPEIIATYSGRISPAVEQYVAHKAVHWPQWQGRLPRQTYEPALLNSIEDTNAPRYQAGKPRGGTNLIKLQSLCPFRAFAERRLNAIAPEEGSFGLDSLERGRFLHDALKQIWDRLKTQGRLREVAPEELRLLVEEVVAEVVECNGNGPLREQASQAERMRLGGLITDWLSVELERKQAFTVETTEEERIYDVAGLQLKLRIDRIDRLPNGKLVLIDYKSGEPSASHLDKDRPKEPQLLVYAAALGREVDGVFFGQLKPRDPRLVGYSRQVHTQDRKSKVLKDWYGFLEERRSKIEELALEFASGEAAVDPLHGACEYCQMKPLCRLNERMRQDEDSE